MLQGKTTIELTNVRTGEKERYEDHNLVTDYISRIYQPIGSLKSPRSYCPDEPPFTELFGGILLFDSELEEKTTNLFIPGGVNVVGCGLYNSVNTTKVPKRGSYNATESETNQTGRFAKFVYDYTTSQANGTIKSVALTSTMAGHGGLGMDAYADNDYYSKYYAPYGASSFSFYSLSRQLFMIDPDDDAFYVVTALTTSSITIVKYRANIHRESVFINNLMSFDVLETHTVQLPADIVATNYRTCYDPEADCLYVISASSTSISANGTFYVTRINMGTYEATVFTMKNSYSSSVSFDRDCWFLVSGDYVYFYYSSGPLRLPLSTGGATYKRFAAPFGSNSASYYGGLYFVIKDRLYYASITSTTINGVSVTYNQMNCVDLKTGKTSIHFANPTNSSSPSYCPIRYKGELSKLIPLKNHPEFYYYADSVESTSSGKYIVRVPYYLATINNLARPIEKTSDKTMKITYTIQEM